MPSPRYPDAATANLTQTIATHYKLTADQVLAGCGSGEILRMASCAFTSPERALVTGAPSFEDPVRHSEMMRAPIRAVAVDASLRLDLGRMLDDWDVLLAAYDAERTAAGNAVVELGRRIGRDQVERTPQWATLAPDEFDAWTKNTLAGAQHYFYGVVAED